MIHFILDFYFNSNFFFFSQGHEKEALQLMATYLPKDTSPGSAYQEGGGLYALGLIHANHGGDIIDYLLSQLKNASNDVSFLTLISNADHCQILEWDSFLK